MALPDDRLQQIIMGKDTDNAVAGESWAIVDGVLVISDMYDRPEWYQAVYESRDDDGNSDLSLCRC